MSNLNFEPTLKTAIHSLSSENHPDKGSVIRGKEVDLKDLSCLTIGDNVTPSFTWDDVETRLTELQTQWTNEEYARNRASAYDSVGDQLDQLMKDMRDGTTTHQTACEAVKAKYPKPE